MDLLEQLAVSWCQGRLLLVWADVPFPLAERPLANPALEIGRWQEAARTLGLPAWPLQTLPAGPILSLDPTARLAAAFRAAGVPLHPVRTLGDVPAPGQHNLLQLGGDLAARAGLFLGWDDVRDAPSDPDKAHLLAEAGRVVQGGVALVLAPAPDETFSRFWRELLGPALRGAAHAFAAGPRGFAWPAPLVWLAAGLEGVRAALVAAAAAAPADLAALRRALNAALDDAALTRFCRDHFPAVYREFGGGVDEAALAGSTPPEALTRLRQAVVQRFDEEGLRNLCQDLGVDYDSLPAQGKAGKARELLAALDRDERLAELVAMLRGSLDKAAKVQQLLDYCQRHGLLDELRERVGTARLAVSRWPGE
ncbi:MAG: hypothetical protein JW900_10195 [Anaerolineae bacterium]|nr:hypothetical protein [Anaerolineae bacterium]